MILQPIGLIFMKQVINYDKRLYTHDALRAAVGAFSPQYPISLLRETREDYQIEFRDMVASDVVIGEFNNYLIQLENRGVRHT